MKTLDLSQFINGMPKEIETPNGLNLKPLENIERSKDPDPACLQYLSQIYRKTTGKYLFRDTRKDSQPEVKAEKIKQLLKEIKIQNNRVKLFQNKLQPYLENNDLDYLPKDRWKYLDWWHKASKKEFELYAKLKDLGLTDEEIYGEDL